MRYFLLFFAALVFCTCTRTEDTSIQEMRKKMPSHIYQYVQIDTAQLNYFETDYVFVYSDIYRLDGTQRYPLTNTISIRNTSTTDTAYITGARYYDSYGKMLHNYLDKTILLCPLESIEYIVEEKESLGGAGANFIVEWGAAQYSNQISIQTVMVGVYMRTNISLLTDAKVIQQRFRK